MRKGTHHSEETRELISATQRGRKNSEERNSRIAEGMRVSWQKRKARRDSIMKMLDEALSGGIEDGSKE